MGKEFPGTGIEEGKKGNLVCGICPLLGELGFYEKKKKENCNGEEYAGCSKLLAERTFILIPYEGQRLTGRDFGDNPITLWRVNRDDEGG